MEFGELNEAEFMTFEQRHPQGTYLQTSWQKQVLSQRGRSTAYVGVFNDQHQVVAAALVSWQKLRIGQLFEIEGGPLMDYRNQVVVKTFTDGLQRFAHQRHGLMIRFIPNLHRRQFNDDGQVVNLSNEDVIESMQRLGFTYQPMIAGFSTTLVGYEFAKDLTGLTATSLVKSYEKDAQYGVKKTQQFGIQLRELTYEQLPQFKKYTQATADRLHFHDKSLDYYQRTFKAYGDRVKFIFAELNFETYIANQTVKLTELKEKIRALNDQLAQKPNNRHVKAQLNEFSDQAHQHEKRITEAQQLTDQYGQIAVLSGAMFFIQPQELTYMFSFTNETFKQFYAPYLIQDHMMHLAIAQHIPRYNFFGVAGLFDGSDGVLAFKQSFGGLTEERLGTFTKPVRPVVYHLYEALKKITGRNEA